MPDDTDYDDLSERTVDEVKEYVTNNDSVDIERLLRHEKRNKDRKTLTSWLKDRVDEQAASDTADSTSGITIQVSKRQAFIATFVIGFFAGGFIMAGAFSAAGATGLVGETANSSEGQTKVENPSGSDNDDETGNAGKVMFPEDIIEGEPTRGSSGNPLTIIEVSDYGCPFCAEWSGVNTIDQLRGQPFDVDEDNPYQKIISNYVETGKARFVYKDYPAHPNAPQAHKAANCIFEQNQSLYWSYHDKLYEQRDSWMQSGQDNPDSTFTDLADQIGADVSAFEQCYNNSSASEARQDQQELFDAAGRFGTPTFFVGTVEGGFVKIEGAQTFDRMKPVIESELAAATSS